LPHADRRSGLRAGQVAGILLIVAGLAGLWQGTRAATAAPAGPLTAARTAPAATASRAGLTVTGAYLSATGPEGALAYFAVTNRGSRPDVLIAVSADEVAHEVSLYPAAAEGQTGTLTLPPGSTVVLAPDTGHVRLALHGPLTLGQHVALSLWFQRAGDLPVGAIVR